MLLWHYHDDDLPGPDAEINLQLSGIPFSNAKVTHYRIDASHSNSFEAWKKMGSPSPLSEAQFSALERAGRLAELEPSKSVAVQGGNAQLRFALPRQGVSLLLLEQP